MESPLGTVVLVHDLSFLGRREAATRNFLLVAFFVLAIPARAQAAKSPLPLLLLHGWPSSYIEMHELVGFQDVWAFERKYAKAP